MPDIVPLTTDHLKAVDKLGDNSCVHLILGENQLLGTLLPALGEKFIVKLGNRNVLGPVLAAPEQWVLEVDHLFPVKETLLSGGRAHGGFDAGVELCCSVLLVDLDGQLQGGGANGLALDPANLLDHQDGLLIIRK